MPTKPASDILQGTLDLLILKTLSLEPMHGWALSQRIRQISGEVFEVNQGSLYPALHRLEHKGWLQSDTGMADNNRQVKIYSLTKRGLKQLTAEQENWERVVTGMARILSASGGLS
jgi:PadR family transcriptional regulator, regulatory protein PadR